MKLQPQQKAELDNEKKRTWLAVYHLDTDRLIQLDDLNVNNTRLLQNGDSDVALAYDETPYIRSFSWTGVPDRDYYLVDIKSGIKREIVNGKSFVQISPGGMYVVWYDPADKSYYSRSTSINRLDTVSLTRIIPVSFHDENDDRPIDPQPYGIAGWSENDRFVYIYDRYDIWKIDPSGERVPVCVTKAYGRRNHIRFRYLKLDPEEENIPSDKTVLLQGFDESTMRGGFFSFRFNAVADPRMLIMDDYHFSNVRKAKEADKIIWTKENVNTFPDLMVSDMSFSQAEKISGANPQQSRFIWPKVQIVEWTSFSGEKLKGLLYLPENLNSDKKYPLLVYFYERNAENLFRHQHPYPSRSTINKTFYVSNGYIVFVPDITYKTGYPGESAYNAVVSGTQYLVNSFSFIDEERMGLQGQSWGGYQTAYIITRTDLYSAAMAGAPVSNMTSAYGGIRWQSGLSRMFQYERQQSRIGGSLWDKPLHYIENSPLFYAPKINTPLLMMHNDDDGAVPWYQGIEMFVALRRLGKPVWLLNYNGEPHNLKETSLANRTDLSRRMFGFFNHYLKKQPMPEWMEKGVPAIKKGEVLGY
ncbi:MAG: prolyl oligopeptidase family serine peptidase [Prolixibacteraceae bacterium]|nr:prolyl oligopeptidase family serine peptidase [Prolixibacteraceae bacterium]